jgi:hypothetical protein
MHDLNPKFEAISYSDQIKYITRTLGYKSPIITQSMFIFKVMRNLIK